MKLNIFRLLAGTVGSLLFIFTHFASANIVTFDDDVKPFVYSSIVSGGLKFEGASTWTWPGPDDGANNGTTNLISGFGNSLTITKVGGGTFTIDQFDAALSWYAKDEWFGIWINSNLIVIGQQFSRFSNGINFDSLTNVTSVTIGIPPADGYFAIDNIVWHNAAVPEPSALMLCLLGFGFVLVRRFRV